jgi:hypothetical protein
VEFSKEEVADVKTEKPWAEKTGMSSELHYAVPSIQLMTVRVVRGRCLTATIKG